MQPASSVSGSARAASSWARARRSWPRSRACTGATSDRLNVDSGTSLYTTSSSSQRCSASTQESSYVASVRRRGHPR